jgi:hypothetical protein
MFITIALAAGGSRRGQNITELVERTGRSKRDLRKFLVRLKAAGIAREVKQGVYRLTDDFASQYELVLDQSGITYAEHEQRRRHDEDRRARDAKLPVDKQHRPLKGKQHNARVLKQRNDEDEQRLIEEQRQKVGATAATFLADELAGVTAMSIRSAKQRWVERGGDPKALWYAIQHGPFRKYREADGTLCIVREDGSWFGSSNKSKQKYGNAREMLEDPPEWLSKQLVKYKANPGSLQKPTAAAIAALYGTTERWKEVAPALAAWLNS